MSARRNQPLGKLLASTLKLDTVDNLHADEKKKILLNHC